MSQPISLVVTATPNPNEADAMRAYLGAALPMLLDAGGTLVKRVAVADVLSGDRAYDMVMVMDFASREQVNDVFASESYKSLVPLREKGFSKLTINIAQDL